MGRSLSCRDPGTGRKVFEPKGKKEELAVAMVCVKSIEPILWPLRVSVDVRSQLLCSGIPHGLLEGARTQA